LTNIKIISKIKSEIRNLVYDQEGGEIFSLYGRHGRRGSLVAQPIWLFFIGALYFEN